MSEVATSCTPLCDRCGGSDHTTAYHDRYGDAAVRPRPQRTEESARHTLIARIKAADDDLLMWGDGPQAALCHLALLAARFFAKGVWFDLPSSPPCGSTEHGP